MRHDYIKMSFLAGLIALTHSSVTIAQSGQTGKPLQPVGGETKYLSHITQLTSQDMGLLNAGEAYFSPDAKTIIFQATPIGQQEYQIYTLNLSTNKLRMVSTGQGACTCAYFHPNGKKIIFASSHLDPTLGKSKKHTTSAGSAYSWDFNKHMDIFEANPDGSNLKQLTTAVGYDAECAYSPDGSQIVFTSQRDGDLEIYTMNADGSNQRRLTKGKGYDGGPFFSPDSQAILYRGDRRNDSHMNLQLRIINPDGSNDRAITDNPIFNWCPYWHPSGTCFIFTQADHGGRPNYDLYVTTTSASPMVRVTFDSAFDGLPVFSPDGKRLMWTSKRGGLDEAQVFIADFKLPGEFPAASKSN